MRNLAYTGCKLVGQLGTELQHILPSCSLRPRLRASDGNLLEDIDSAASAPGRLGLRQPGFPKLGAPHGQLKYVRLLAPSIQSRNVMFVCGSMTRVPGCRSPMQDLRGCCALLGTRCIARLQTYARPTAPNGPCGHCREQGGTGRRATKGTCSCLSARIQAGKGTLRRPLRSWSQAADSSNSSKPLGLARPNALLRLCPGPGGRRAEPNRGIELGVLHIAGPGPNTCHMCLWRCASQASDFCIWKPNTDCCMSTVCLTAAICWPC